LNQQLFSYQMLFTSVATEFAICIGLLLFLFLHFRSVTYLSTRQVQPIMASIRPDQELYASNPDKEVEETPEMADSPFRAPFNQMANAVDSFANVEGIVALH
jgi:hypothetical protein